MLGLLRGQTSGSVPQRKDYAVEASCRARGLAASSGLVVGRDRPRRLLRCWRSRPGRTLPKPSSGTTTTRTRRRSGSPTSTGRGGGAAASLAAPAPKSKSMTRKAWPTTRPTGASTSPTQAPNDSIAWVEHRRQRRRGSSTRAGGPVDQTRRESRSTRRPRPSTGQMPVTAGSIGFASADGGGARPPEHYRSHRSKNPYKHRARHGERPGLLDRQREAAISYANLERHRRRRPYAAPTSKAADELVGDQRRSGNQSSLRPGHRQSRDRKASLASARSGSAAVDDRARRRTRLRRSVRAGVRSGRPVASTGPTTAPAKNAPKRVRYGLPGTGRPGQPRSASPRRRSTVPQDPLIVRSPVGTGAPTVSASGTHAHLLAGCLGRRTSRVPTSTPAPTSYAYQWSMNGQAIGGRDRSAALTATDRGSATRCAVTGTNPVRLGGQTSSGRHGHHRAARGRRRDAGVADAEVSVQKAIKVKAG